MKREDGMTVRRFSCVVMLAAITAIVQPAETAKAETEDYLGYVTKCLDTLIEYGTDRSGPKQTPVLVSILDTETRQCPSHPAALDESWRVKESWYRDYAERYAPEGTYAGLYGQSVSFLLHLCLLTGEPHYLRLARETADDAIARLFHNGLFRGHPAKPYYEAVDGVGYLLYALLELDQVIKHPEPALPQKKIVIGDGLQQTALPLDNW